MKKNLFLLVFSFFILFTSCDDDDQSGSFVGVWIGNNISVFDCNRDSDNSDRSIRCDDASCYRLELNANKTFSYQEGLPTRSGTWSPSGGLTLCVEEDGEQVCETYAVALTSSTLVISTTNETVGCTTAVSFVRETEADDSSEQ